MFFQETRYLAPHLRMKGNMHRSVCCSRLQMSKCSFQPPSDVDSLHCFYRVPSWHNSSRVNILLWGLFSFLCLFVFLSHSFNLDTDECINDHMTISLSCFWDSSHFSVWMLEVTSLFVSHRHNAVLSWASAPQDVFFFGFYVLLASDHFSSMSFDLIQIM